VHEHSGVTESGGSSLICLCTVGYSCDSWLTSVTAETLVTSELGADLETRETLSAGDQTAKISK
jgi:hypothetical protein